VLTGRAHRVALASLFAFSFTLATVAPAFAAIHSGDTLFVRVWNHPELSMQVTVDSTGSVRVPLSGVVSISGLDEGAAAKKLDDALRPYIIYPAVDVQTIEQGKMLFVSGGPGGTLKYSPGETLAAAIAEVMQTGNETTQSLNESGQSLTKVSGANSGLRNRIDLRNVKVQRDGGNLGVFDEVAFSAQGEPGPVLQPGDTIVFSYKPVDVRVIGDVAQPGMTYLAADQSLSEAISQAGGLLPTSVSNHVLLQRDGTTRSLALGDPAFTSPAQNGDIVTVPLAPRVNVVGTVVNPGLVSLRSDSSLLSAMYTAGGPTKWADLKNVQIVRGSTKTSYNVVALTHGDISQNPPLQDGDTVVVPQNHAIDWSGIFGILGGVAAGLASRVPL
jgi:protein involved in polysaccharide export with SLBB domain